MVKRLMFTQLKVGDTFLWQGQEYRKIDKATALNLSTELNRYFDQTDAVELPIAS